MFDPNARQLIPKIPKWYVPVPLYRRLWVRIVLCILTILIWLYFSRQRVVYVQIPESSPYWSQAAGDWVPYQPMPPFPKP